MFFYEQSRGEGVKLPSGSDLKTYEWRHQMATTQKDASIPLSDLPSDSISAIALCVFCASPVKLID